MLHHSECGQSQSQVVVVVGNDQPTRAMRRAVLEALAGRPRDLVIDLREVDYLSKPGLALLVGARARQRARRQRLTLVCASDSATAQALSRSGMRGAFTTVPQLGPPLLT